MTLGWPSSAVILACCSASSFSLPFNASTCFLISSIWALHSAFSLAILYSSVSTTGATSSFFSSTLAPGLAGGALEEAAFAFFSSSAFLAASSSSFFFLSSSSLLSLSCSSYSSLFFSSSSSSFLSFFLPPFLSTDLPLFESFYDFGFFPSSLAETGYAFSLAGGSSFSNFLSSVYSFFFRFPISLLKNSSLFFMNFCMSL